MSPMAKEEAGAMLTAAKLAEAAGASAGKVKKLIDELGIEPDQVQRGCRYYGPATLAKIKAELGKPKG
jgi:hypothetical protein